MQNEIPAYTRLNTRHHIKAMSMETIKTTAPIGFYIVADEPITQDKVYDPTIDELREGATCIYARVRENKQPWPHGCDIFVRPDGMMVILQRGLIYDQYEPITPDAPEVEFKGYVVRDGDVFIEYGFVGIDADQNARMVFNLSRGFRRRFERK